MKSKKVKCKDPFSDIAKDLAIKFDDATDAGDTELLRSLIRQAEEVIKTQDKASQLQIYYSLGTAYGDLEKLDAQFDREALIEKQLYYFRKSVLLTKEEELQLEELKPYILGIKRILYVNYGNALDQCGRKISAIEQYFLSLEIDPTFGMAIGNLGMAYIHYGLLVSDPSQRDYFHHFAYNYLSRAISTETHDTSPEASEYFKESRDRYDADYVKNVLSAPLNIPQYHYDEPEENSYRTWALNNRLFLNPLNDLPIMDFCFAADVLHLPGITVKIDDKPIFHGMFNQIKQEYIFARYQFYCSLQIPDATHFADKDTYLLNFADYPQYSIRIEKIKSSYKTLYSLLDKIAFFINEYFNLGIKEQDVSFRSIWETEKKGKNGYHYTNVLMHENNFALQSIYWINKDFVRPFLDSPNPWAKRISIIRNALEHKYVKVFSQDFPAQTDGEIDDLALYVSECELTEQTMFLLKLVRETIICLALAVGIEEIYREDQAPMKGITVPITIMQYDDEWKR